VRQVLFVSFNHPSIRPGGMENYSEELFQAIRQSGRFDAAFVSRIGPPDYTQEVHAGTRFALAGDSTNLYYFYTGAEEFDRVLWAARDKRVYTEDWRRFLELIRPDVVHFHHALWLGYDIIRETRSVLPHAPIVYTLHEFVPICHHDGQMVRTQTYDLCHESSARRCNQCFPDISVQDFFLRERFVKSSFELVDMFIAPSEQLRQRYIEWGIAPDKIRYEDYGRVPVPALSDPPDAGRRKRIGFFGQITRFKGVDVLLEAMQILERENAGVGLILRGANLERQHREFRDRIAELLAQVADSVQFTGPYAQAELPGLLSSVDWVVVPSIWWENAPLVIQEAKMHRRPVICSDIGGMAEKVRDGVDGLHFHVRDPHSLADTIRRAVATPELWDRLRAGIGEAPPMDRHVDAITGIYDALLHGSTVSVVGS
jgi:glycosyltransferase involved in cell wall biosynthesis